MSKEKKQMKRKKFEKDLKCYQVEMVKLRERVMGFATEEQADYFLENTPAVERAIIDSGIILIKYWLEVGKNEQAKRCRLLQ